MAVGMAEGLLSLQKRKPEVEEVKKPKKTTVSYRYGLRGKTVVPNKVYGNWLPKIMPLL